MAKLSELVKTAESSSVEYCVFTAIGHYNRCSICEYPMMYGATRRCRGPREVPRVAPYSLPQMRQTHFVDSSRGLIRMPPDGHLGGIEM